jgi:hypothetical protein
VSAFPATPIAFANMIAGCAELGVIRELIKRRDKIVGVTVRLFETPFV